MMPVIASSERPSPPSDENSMKHQGRIYHHRHRLVQAVEPGLLEPAITQDATVDHLMNRAIGHLLSNVGFDFADPVALDGFRSAAEEYMLHLVSLVHQSMAVCRRAQPIPQDFEHALKRSFLSVDDLPPYVAALTPIIPAQTLLPNPLPEDGSDFTAVPFLDSHQSSEEDRIRNLYIPKHFPQFPSKHTYRTTPVLTERELDPKKIRERATEDGRHGEEALRRLARAAFKNSQPTGAAHREKRFWGRKSENMETMFEKTLKELAKKAPKGVSDALLPTQPVESNSVQKPAMVTTVELGPIVNCERGLWRKPAFTASRKTEKAVDVKDHSSTARIEHWHRNHT